MSDLDRTYRIGPIHLAPTVTRLQGWTLLLGAFFSIGLMTFISIGQTYILNEHLGIPTSEQGTISGDLVFWTEIITLIFFIPVGIVVDRIGRRSIFALGFLLLAATYLLYPNAAGVDDLYAYRFVYALGVVTIAAGLSTVLADYPAERSRGKLVAIVGLLSGLGIVFTNQGFGALPKALIERGMDGVQAGYYTHYAVAALAITVAVLVFLGLQKGIPVRREERPSVRDLFLSGFSHARNPRVLLSYAAAFIARGDQSVNATFLILWGTTAGLAAGMETAEAVKNGTIIFVLAQVAALVWAPIMGPIMDRMDRVSGLALSMVLAAIGNLSVIWLVDPMPGTGMVFYILLGIGQISVYLGAQSLIGQEAPAAKRGSVLSAFNVAGAIGILLITAVGGRIFDAIDPRAPFVLVGIINILLFFGCILVRLRFSSPAMTTAD
ncbi:MFS transporter [Thiorhodococcus mannitoliphagus]|uniref:MFS transporter n=1 Tax=Thiorhodococcus mannitoliphagus TaxID=329406 RepID=A0A6P1DVV6_9GAMM|nr:MFS transporter [Thiorhodococcus mannitoliphagus]NEX19775.1 MFS transporter [Thiorhodococcus mannitoliphagus]